MALYSIDNRQPRSNCPACPRETCTRYLQCTVPSTDFVRYQPSWAFLGRFQDEFVESRRIALERCLRKIVAHPMLYGDPDLKVFLESESFNIDVSVLSCIRNYLWTATDLLGRKTKNEPNQKLQRLASCVHLEKRYQMQQPVHSQSLWKSMNGSIPGETNWIF